MAPSPLLPLAYTLLIVLALSTPAAAFGAGKIISVSQVAGKNWRHGDIEDTLLELFISAAGRAKFDNLAVKRVYFGNWLRDYSQAIDVGGLKQLPKDTIRVMLWVLSFVTFGFATGEFEVTEDRLGCYRPEEHIDNPKDYADNEDARVYDSRLRAPVDERKELAVDEQSGMKVYIASENHGIDTSAGFVRKCFTRSIELGRKYGRDGRDVDLYEALRLLGTGLHTLEDFAAHSNYVELALNELGVDAFAHVGDNCKVRLNGKSVPPVITGTFGMTDFLHSVVGEVSDKLIQSEVQELENKVQDASNKNHGETTSTLKTILEKIPFGLLGLGDDDFSGQADKLQEAADAKEFEQKASIAPGAKKATMSAEDVKRQAAQTVKDIYPILEFHDKVMKAITQGIEKIPGAEELLENLSGAMQIFIFSVLSPYVVPILDRVKVELSAGSAGILQSSEKGQYVVFNDDNSDNPTHSMLSKDHFTNVLNEVGGRVASEIVRFAVPQITAAWDNKDLDANGVVDEILQVLHHPALRRGEGQLRMFEVVKSWWEEKNHSEQATLRDALSKEGVKDGRNHVGDDPVGGPGGKNHSHNSCGHGHGGGSAAGRQQRIEQSTSGYGGQQSLSNRRDDTDRGYGGSGGRERGTGTHVLDAMPAEMSSFMSGGGSGRGARDEESTSRGIGGGGYGQRDEPSSTYGRGERESHGGRDEETSDRYGSTREPTSSYGGRDTESSGYGGESTFGGRTHGSGKDYGGNDEYGSGRHGRQIRDEEPSSGYGHAESEEGVSGRFGGRHNRDEEQPRIYAGSYTRAEETAGYGGRRNDESFGFGGRHGRDEEPSSGYGGVESSGYGGGLRGRDDEADTGLHSGRQYGHQESESYGRGGSGHHDRNDTAAFGRRGGLDEQHDEAEFSGRGSRRFGGGEDEHEDQGGRGYGAGSEGYGGGGGYGGGY